MTSIIFDSAADRDLDDIVEYLYGEAGYNTVLSFLASVEKTLSTIRTLPYSGIACRPLLPSRPELRRLPISNQFGNWLLFYQVASHHVEVVRILYGKQKWITLLR